MRPRTNADPVPSDHHAAAAASDAGRGGAVGRSGEVRDRIGCGEGGMHEERSGDFGGAEGGEVGGGGGGEEEEEDEAGEAEAEDDADEAERGVEEQPEGGCW